MSSKIAFFYRYLVGFHGVAYFIKAHVPAVLLISRIYITRRQFRNGALIWSAIRFEQFYECNSADIHYMQLMGESCTKIVSVSWIVPHQFISCCWMRMTSDDEKWEMNNNEQGEIQTENFWLHILLYPRYKYIKKEIPLKRYDLQDQYNFNKSSLIQCKKLYCNHIIVCEIKRWYFWYQ